MKTLTLLLLLATLVTTALSQPTFWPFRRQAAPAVTLPTHSNTAAPAVTLPTHSNTAVTLPHDLLLKIGSHADPKTRHSLRTNKALKEAFNLELPGLSLEDLDKFEKSDLKAKAFYRAILKKDTDAVKRLYPGDREHEQRIFGLVLAARYDSPKAAWILLACGTLKKVTNTEERDKLRGDAEGRLNEKELADLAELARITNAAFSRDRDSVFLRTLILNRQDNAYRLLGLLWGPTKDALKLGLHLAVQDGTKTNILMLLAFGSWDLDMDSKLIKEAMEKLPQTDLDFLEKIQTGAPDKRNFWKAIVGWNFFSKMTIEIDHDTAIIGMQLAVMCGRTYVGSELLLRVEPDIREKLIHAAATLATNADKSENLQQNWKQMEEHFDGEMRNRNSFWYRFRFVGNPEPISIRTVG